MTQTTELQKFIQAEAKSLGFSLFGVTEPTPPPHLSVFKHWISLGMYGSMDYLASNRSLERRVNPRLIAPECQSVICLGMPYQRPADGIFLTEDGEPVGRIAAYALGNDYHKIITGRLTKLAAIIESHLGTNIQFKAYTDTGPILERDLAQQSGLGWIGKNTNLINLHHGSYFLLSEIFINRSFELSPPFQKDHCGTCRRCIDACPTACIRTDRTIDARRCISYLTIENKGEIPAAYRPLIGECVFGCDICQMVCPWNLRFSGPDPEPALSSQSGPLFPGLVETLTLGKERFAEIFRESPVLRTKWRGYLRNAITVLGNLAYIPAVPGLTHILRSEPDSMLRSHAAWSLGQIRTRSAVYALEQASLSENDPVVQNEIHHALEMGK